LEVLEAGYTWGDHEGLGEVGKGWWRLDRTGLESIRSRAICQEWENRQYDAKRSFFWIEVSIYVSRSLIFRLTYMYTCSTNDSTTAV
jgi:hypothetical protein